MVQNIDKIPFVDCPVLIIHVRMALVLLNLCYFFIRV